MIFKKGVHLFWEFSVYSKKQKWFFKIGIFTSVYKKLVII